LLESIAAADKEGAPEARVWLDLLGQSFVPEFVLPNTTKSRPTKLDANTFLEISPYLRAYPNPSTGPVYLAYEVREGVDQVELHVHDATGRLMHTERLAARNGILELTSASLAPGMHIASLRFDGILVGTAKVEVLR
jgi:hypothetical protein